MSYQQKLQKELAAMRKQSKRDDRKEAIWDVLSIIGQVAIAFGFVAIIVLRVVFAGEWGQ